MSFWKQSPGPHWKDAFQLFFTKNTPAAYLYQQKKIQLPSCSNPTVKIKICNQSQMNSYADFLHTHFKITEKSRCSIPPERLQLGIQNGWICIGAFNDTNELIGTIVSRPLGTCVYSNRSRGIQYGTQQFENCGYIDFFCIHPKYQKQQIGSDLLLFVQAASSQENRFVHFFLKEISPLWILPPIYASQYIVRINPSFLHHPKSPPTIPIGQLSLRGARQTTVSGNSIVFLPNSNTQDTDTQIYFKDLDGGRIYLAVTDLYHHTKARELYGGPIGEILWTWVEHKGKILTDEEIINGFEFLYDLLPYEVLLADINLPHNERGLWQKDVSYFLYAYNLNPQQFFTLKPWFFFT